MKLELGYQEVTILLADIRGFTTLSETLGPQETLEILNYFLISMCEIADANGSTVDKFLGDAIMVLFGSDCAKEAITCAILMQNEMDSINEALSLKGLPSIHSGIDINTGRVSICVLGSGIYSERTAIGDHVNAAFRIEAFSLRGQILAAESTIRKCNDSVNVGETLVIRVKGKETALRLHEIVGVPSLNLWVSKKDSRFSIRVKTEIQFNYSIVRHRILEYPKLSGITLNLGYGGMLAEVEDGLSEYDDLVIEIAFPLFGSKLHIINAKVVNLIESRIMGIQFTSMRQYTEQILQNFVQILIQGAA